MLKTCVIVLLTNAKCLFSRPFSKMAAENSNKLKLDKIKNVLERTPLL